jgi:3-oxoacyl-[acyl-carrier protein] reductase
MKAQRTAVVLAGSEGLGLAAAHRLAYDGHRVVMFSRSTVKLDLARTTFKEHGKDVSTIQGDITSAADLDRLFAHVEESFGGADILVNNTGGPRPGNILELSDDDWRLAFEEQAISLIRAIRRVVPGMRQRGWGRIITIASLSVKAPIDGLDLSNFMRGGLAAVHRTLARTLAPHDINVHMVLPGSIMTASRCPSRKPSPPPSRGFPRGVSVSLKMSAVWWHFLPLRGRTTSRETSSAWTAGCMRGWIDADTGHGQTHRVYRFAVLLTGPPSRPCAADA